MHDSADNTNILFINKTLKKINKYVNGNVKLLCQWIRSNKLSLNPDKTEIIIFMRKHQVITKHLNFRDRGQEINPTTSVKYLGVFLNDSLTWNIHLANLIPNLTELLAC